MNDYLGRRDAETLQPLFDALGLTVGVVVQSRPKDLRQRSGGLLIIATP